MPPAEKSSYNALRDSLKDQPRTWLVTGAAGFIGSNIVQELLSLGQQVVGLDNFSTGFRSNLDEALAADPGATGTLRFIEGDIRDMKTCSEACSRVDFVIHQAALASVPRSVADPVETSHVNVDGFQNILLGARDSGAKRVVYASSSAVYGDAAGLPQKEENTGALLSPYAAHKATNELYAGVFYRAYGLESIGLRYFNVFGRRQDPNGAYAAVIPRWVIELLNGSPAVIYGDGETTRDFVHVSNVVQANILAATTTNRDAMGRAYNVACGEETSLNSLFTKLRDRLAAFRDVAANAKPRHEAARVGDIRRSVADISRIQSFLEFEPVRLLDDGLDEAIDWYVNSLTSVV